MHFFILCHKLHTNLPALFLVIEDKQITGSNNVTSFDFGTAQFSQVKEMGVPQENCQNMIKKFAGKMIQL